MNLIDECNLSYYEEVGVINKVHNVTLVQHAETGRFFVKKSCKNYNIDMFIALRDNPVKGMPRIHELFESDGKLIIIEEYLSGDTLETSLEKHGPYSESDAIELTLNLCSIVARLHAFNPPIVHRDIKPTNIIISPDNSVKLLDLSAARQSSEDKNQDTIMMGTAGYAAPEQYGFSTSSPATDIYAIGVVMNRILTGKMLNEQHYNGRLWSVISKCTKLNSEERYPSVTTLANDLRNYLANASQHTNAPKHNNLDKKASWKKFLPPGFRGKNPAVMILAGLGYAILFSLSLTLTTKTSNAYQTFITRLFLTLMFAVIILFSGNYLGIQSLFPLTKSKKLPLRIFGIIIWDFVFMFCTLVFIVILGG